MLVHDWWPWLAGFAGLWLLFLVAAGLIGWAMGRSAAKTPPKPPVVTLVELDGRPGAQQLVVPSEWVDETPLYLPIDWAPR